MKDLAREIVAEIEPDTGWWNSNTEDVLVEIADEMLETMDVDSVQSCLERAHRAIAAEYGE